MMLALILTTLSACQGGVVSDDVIHSDAAPGAHALGEPGPTAYTHLQDYLAVVRDPKRFDECLTDQPMAYPHRCLVGARTGSRSGHAVHQWMYSQLQQIDGLESVTQQDFAWDRFAPEAYHLSVQDGTGGVFEPAVYPWHFQGVTGSAGVTGPLINLGDGNMFEQLSAAGALQGKIAILASMEHLNASEEDAQSKLQALTDAGAIAAIYALPGPENDIVAQNYDAAEGLRNLPTLIVGKFDRERLIELEGKSATLTLQGSQQSSRSFNTYGFIPGQDRSRMIVIGTPMNSWFQAASERGPGVGALIYLARYFADKVQREGPPPVTLAFVATGAHETLGYGLERALRCLGTSQIMAYLHLGTGLASRGYVEDNRQLVATGQPSARRWIIVSENMQLESLVDEAFADAMSEQGLTRVRGGVFNHGESQIPYAMGIPLIGMTGGGFFHHSPRDDETRLSVDYLGPVVLGYRNAIEALLQTQPVLLALANAPAEVLALTSSLPGYACPSAVATP